MIEGIRLVVKTYSLVSRLERCGFGVDSRPTAVPAQKLCVRSELDGMTDHRHRIQPRCLASTC